MCLCARPCVYVSLPACVRAFGHLGMGKFGCVRAQARLCELVSLRVCAAVCVTLSVCVFASVRACVCVCVVGCVGVPAHLVLFACAFLCVHASGRVHLAKRTADVLLIVLFPLNVTVAPYAAGAMNTAPPLFCAQRRSVAGRPPARARAVTHMLA